MNFFKTIRKCKPLRIFKKQDLIGSSANSDLKKEEMELEEEAYMSLESDENDYKSQISNEGDTSESEEWVDEKDDEAYNLSV